ncbi:MAG TPA: hypothetical protein VIK52_04590, partial [Opitutaceae bacterium]
MKTRSWVHWFISTATILGPAIHSRSEEDTTPGTGAYAEKVELVPDASVADSLARQKNLNFSSVRIDGETSEISLSSLTADQILNAVVTKVPTPDQDADAVGGLLQLTSRRAFDQKERTLRGSFGVSYDPLASEPATDASITFGRSFVARRLFGFLATLEFKRDNDRDEEIELNWDPDTARLDNFQVEEKQEKSVETNFNCSLDWKLGEASLLFFRTEAQFASGRDRSRSLGYDIPSLPEPVPATGADVRGALKRSLEEGRERSNALTL